MKRLQDRVAVITGTAQGLGLVFLKKFLDEGAKVVSIDINGELLRKEMAALDSDNILTIEMDVVDEAAWKDAVKQTMERFGRLDILVNNAAQLYHKDIKTMPLDEWRRELDVNLTGCFLGMQNCYEVMTKGSIGSIINIGSTSSLMAGTALSVDVAYNTTKSGIRMLTKHGAFAYVADGIRVNSVVPGGVDSPMRRALYEKEPWRNETVKRSVPLAPHCMNPENIAEAVIFLASDSSFGMTGSEIVMDNGFSSIKLS